MEHEMLDSSQGLDSVEPVS